MTHPMIKPKLKHPHLESPGLTPGDVHNEGEFRFSIQTVGADDTFTLPIYNGGTYTFFVQWGDGSSDTIVAYDDAARVHTYAVEGLYHIDIHGTLEGFRFNNLGDKTLIRDIHNWGNLVLGDGGDYFDGCSNLTITATDLLNTSGMQDFSDMFKNCAALDHVPRINEWDMSSALDTSFMFQSCDLFNDNLSLWDMSENLDMKGMFWGCTIFNQDISGWNVAKSETFSGTFYEAAAFNQDISAWDTGACITMANMFNKATIFNQDLSTFDISINETMSGMFQDTALDDTNYSSMLVTWNAGAHLDNVSLHAGGAVVSGGPAIAAKAHLISIHSWTITDGS